MSPQVVAATAVAKQESYTFMSGQLSHQYLEMEKRTEQLGRSETDCAPTSNAASRVCSSKKHFIVTGIPNVG